MSPLHVPLAEKGLFSSLRRNRPFPKPATSPILVLALCSAFGLGIRLDAGLVYWGSQGFVVNADSRDRVWTADFSMVLGVFQKGFVPTSDNRESWNGNWVQLAVAAFDPLEARFAGVADLSQPLPAGVDNQVYFWARNGIDLAKGPEWLLMTRSEWKWPASSPAGNPALTWTTGTPASPVLGEIGINGHHLTSARVAPVPVPFDDWLTSQFPDSPSNRIADADPDGDGLSNRLEYFLGSDPNNGSSAIFPEIHPSGDGTMLALRRNPRAESGFSVESSTNLLVWKSSDAVMIEDRPDFIEVRVPGDPSVKSGFFRIKLEDKQP